MHIRKIVTALTVALLVGCGGGGEGSSSACSALKINGGESCDGGVPSVAYLEMVNGANVSTCTGTLISQTAVLTAAHCVAGRPEQIGIAVPGYVRAITQYFIHPSYRGDKGGLDLAILKFADPIPVGPTPLLVSSGSPNPGDELVAYGYGRDQEGQGAGERVSAGEAPLKATYLSFYGASNGDFYETISTGSGNLCKGDSGGPILAKNQNGEWGIIAVTSNSPAISETVMCVPTKGGTLSYVSSVQSNLAMAFILAHVPDAALN